MLNGLFLLNKAAAPQSYWLGYINYPGRVADGRGVTVDSLGNAYFIGTDYAAGYGSSKLYLAKFNSAGALQWQKTLGSANSDEGTAVAIDASGYVYVVGSTNAPGPTYLLLAKYDSAGTLQWQKRIGGPSNGTQGRGVTVDSSGNVYACGISYDASYNTILYVFKYDASGNLTWQRQLPNASGSNSASGICVDGSGNVYVCGDTYGALPTILLVKYNSSGTLQWQYSIAPSNKITYGRGVAVDSSGNIYITGFSEVTSGTYSYQFITMKLNSTGAIQWQRTLNSSTNNEQSNSVAVDSSGNTYIAGYSDFGGINKAYVVKYDSSGAIQWQRKITAAVASAWGVAVDSSGNPYIIGNTSVTSSTSFLIAKVPSDGTKTGSYTVGGYTFTYDASTFTDAASTASSTSSSFSSSPSSLTSSTSSQTDAAASSTAVVTTI